MTTSLELQFEAERRDWRLRAVAALKGRALSTGELVKAMGAKGFDDGSKIVGWLKRQPDFHRTHKAKGPTGRDNWFWVHRP